MCFRKIHVFFVGLVLLFAPVKSISAQPLTIVSPQDATIVDTTIPVLTLLQRVKSSTYPTAGIPGLKFPVVETVRVTAQPMASMNMNMITPLE